MDDPASPEYQAIAESQRRAATKRQAFDEYAAQADTERETFNTAVSDYYKALREKHSDFSNLGWEFRDEDYLFIDAVQPAIESAEDPQLLKERIAAAGMYSNLFQVPISTAFQNLEDFHQQWTGKNFVKKTGLEAVADSIQLNFVSAEYNRLAKELAKSGGNDSVLLEAVQEHEKLIDRLRDHTPKVWQDDYVKMGGWHDVGQAVRSVTTSVAENLGPIATGIGASALAATGVGAIAGAAGLSSATSALLVAGASRTAIAGSTYNSTWGIKYREMTNQGIPHDIAQSYAKIDGATQGIIEALLGGLESAGGRAIASSIVPQAVTRATNRWFISGKMSLAAKATLGWLQGSFEEGSEEVLGGISSGQVFNMAADAANQRRTELLQKIAEEPFEEIRLELEKELEKHPEVDKKKWGAILQEAKEGGIAGFLTGLILGIPVEIVGYRADVRAARVLADIAKDSPNMAAFKENLKNAEAGGFNNPFAEGLKTDEETALLADIYKIQQERMTPEERESKQKAVQDASALAEVTDYSNAEVEDTPELDEKGNPTGGIQLEIVPNAQGDIYRNDAGRLETSQYTDATEDGGIEGRYVAGDPRTPTEDGNQYGYINYTEKDGTITIDDFKMLAGYASLRGDFYQQFAEDHPGQNIVWNPKNEQNIAIREQLINSNPRGPKNGLNYFEDVEQAPVSAEAREVARRFSPYLTNSTPLETALAVETFRTFYQKRGESLQGAMSRLLGRVTNTAPDAAIAAQRAGKTVKGATWLEQTAAGMRHVIYLSKNAADSSTVVHEVSHAVAADFTETERNIAARALNGYKLKNGTTVSFEENTPWTDEQHEAFAEALENYLTNGTAPNEEIKGLFERIKEFMKRIYQKMKGWTELSPQVEQFYKSLLSGKIVDQARSENASQTHEEGRSATPQEKTINDTVQDEITRQREVVITSPDISLKDKAQAVIDAAGAVLMQVMEEDIAEAQRQYNEVYDRYHDKKGKPLTGWLKAPNGKDTNLTERQWVMVRTQNFKKWFGDWENKPEESSKIIDANGEPLSVFKAMYPYDYTQETDGYKGPRLDIIDRPVLFPTFDSKETKGVKISGFFGDRETAENFLTATKSMGWEIYSVFLNFRNPGVIDAKNQKAGDIQFGNSGKLFRDLIRSGLYDSVIIKNTSDENTLYVALNPTQIKSATDNAGTFSNENPSILFQDENTDLIKEASEFPNGTEYRIYVEFMYDGNLPGYEIETAGLSDVALNAWYDEFVSKAKIAVESSDQTEGAESGRQEPISPAEKDRSFIEMISDTKARDDFLGILKNYTSGRYGYTEEDIDSGRADKLNDLIQGKLKHPLWTTFFMAQGEIKESHKKKLLGLIRKYPRDYRAIYSEVMERPEMAVSAEDTTAEILKHRISDSRRETIDTLSPEKLSQLAEQLDVEEYAAAVRKGTAKLIDPMAKKLVKSLDAQIAELETQLKKEEADHKEENEYLYRQVSSQFLKTFENVLAAAEELEAAKGEVDKAIKTGSEDLGKIARRAARVQANYWNITEELDAYKEAQDLGLHVRELLNEAKLADYAKSAKEQARMARQDEKQELADYAKSAREQNAMSQLLHKAEMAQMKAALKEKHRQKEALKRLRAEDKRNLALIFQTPGVSVAHEYGKAIGLIQRLFKATMDTTVKAIGEDAKDYGLETIMRRIEEKYGEGSAKETEEAALKYLPSQVFYRIQDKPLSEWTIEERRELAKIIVNLAREGRELRKAQIAEYNRRIAMEKAAIAKTIKTVTDPKLQDHPDDTPEEKERKRNAREATVNAYRYGIPGTAQAADARRKFKPSGLEGFLKYNYMDNSRFVEYILDGGSEAGPSSAILTRRVNSAWNQRQAAIDSRMKIMQDATEKDGVNLADLYGKAAELDLGGAIGKQTFTVSELIGVTLAVQNEYSDAALRTGNLLSRTERNAWIKQMSGIEDEAQREKLDAEYMVLSTQRYNAVTSMTKSFFAKEENKKFLPVIETMRKDYAANAERINDGLIEYNNTEIQQQKNYYPIDRVEPTSAYVQDSKLMRELVGSAASGFQMYVERGFTKGRIKIPPQFQSAINLDAMSVWVNSVNAQEHFLAYGQLVKEVNRIYKDPNSEARIWIRQRYGEDGIKRLDRLIKDMVSDGQGHESNGLDDVVRFFRKNYSTAVLGFRVISGLKQVITSPAAFMGQGITPWEYLAAHLDYLTHQKERWNEIAALSEIMEHRSANFLIDEAKQEAATAADPKERRLARFRKASMIFQEIADNITVAPGWYLLYKKEFNRLTEDKGTAKLDVKDRQVKAVEYADKIITRIQPTGRAQDIAPVFKDNGELGKAYLQFTQQLSIIFQDLFYDTPVQIRRGQIKNVIGKFIGFATAGLLIGLLTEAADGIGEDGEDDKKKAARFIAYGISQFTDSIPLIGTSATDTINLIATGRMQYHVNGSPLRTIESGAQSIQNIVRAVQQSDSEKAIKALQQGLTTLGYVSGLPAAQFNDLVKVAQKMAEK